ncbi:uncharacterized protein LOC141856560 [Brevipalpus obovatus]|uniref:uncharacterized protein LOC141856560 n=1 Tax=Brevipalpus obovatus TaxID=246614 RepID=UPI003D9DC544
MEIIIVAINGFQNPRDLLIQDWRFRGILLYLAHEGNHTEHSPEMRIHEVNQPRITNNDLHPGQGAMSPVNSHGQQHLSQDISALPMISSFAQQSPSSGTDKAYVPVVNLVDPLVIIAIFALPLLGLLGIGAFLFPLLPIGIYLLITYLPSGAAAGRKKRSTSNQQEFIEDVFKSVTKAIQSYLPSLKKDHEAEA